MIDGVTSHSIERYRQTDMKMAIVSSSQFDFYLSLLCEKKSWMTVQRVSWAYERSGQKNQVPWCFPYVILFK
jgi:hypothetical protein